jgi:hypothetical protein
VTEVRVGPVSVVRRDIGAVQGRVEFIVLVAVAALVGGRHVGRVDEARVLTYVRVRVEATRAFR